MIYITFILFLYILFVIKTGLLTVSIIPKYIMELLSNLE